MTGCGDPAAIQLVLTPSPELNDIPTLLARLSRVAVVADAAGGLNGVEDTGERPGGGEAVDWDDDGILEVTFESPVLAGDELPVLEIGVGQNTGRELFFTVLGFADEAAHTAEEAVAFGGASALCPPGEMQTVGLPFNLRAGYRSPKVVMVLPADGSEGVPQSLVAVTVVFSTTVQETSLAGRVALWDPDDVAVPFETLHRNATFTGEDGREELRSILQIQIGGLLGGLHRLEINPGILGRNGLSFDQRPDQKGENGFTSSFDVLSTIGGGEAGCLPGCPPGYACDPVLDGCVPATDCDEQCGTGYVCDPDSNTCVWDCRLFGACLAPGASCDPETGLCG